MADDESTRGDRVTADSDASAARSGLELIELTSKIPLLIAKFSLKEQELNDIPF
jgi:hypothetical protein